MGARDGSDDDIDNDDVESSGAGEDESDGEDGDQEDGPLSVSNAVDDAILPGASSDSPLLLFQVR